MVPYGLIGNPVKIGDGPAAVIGDETCRMPLPEKTQGQKCVLTLHFFRREGAGIRRNRESEDLPELYKMR